jgi:hypothetical protein
MIAKSLIAAAALAASITAFAPAQEAQAKTNIDIGIGFGFGGFYPGYGYGYGYPGYGYGYTPYHRPYYQGISCRRGQKIVDWSGFNNVRAVDCSLPGYKYTAWKRGHQYLVKVNAGGNITGVNRLY